MKSKVVLALFAACAIVACSKKPVGPASGIKKDKPPVTPAPVRSDATKVEEISQLGVELDGTLARELWSRNGNGVDQFRTLNCFKLIKNTYPDGSSELLVQGFGKSCSDAQKQDLKFTATIDPITNFLIMKKLGSDQPIRVGSVLEHGTYPGPNTYNLMSLCSTTLSDSIEREDYTHCDPIFTSDDRLQLEQFVLLGN